MMTSHETITVTPTAAETAAAWVNRQFELMAHGDLEDFRHYTHPEATNREALTEPPECRGAGPEARYATALWLRSMFSDLRWEIHEIVAQSDLIAIHVTMTGRHTGPYTKYGAAGALIMNRPATGRTFTTTQSHWFRIADGKTIEHWANRDDLGMATQLGFLGPPPP
jgi:predicted ester cyclase